MNDNGIIGIGKFSFLHLPLAQFITSILILWVFQEIQTLLFLFIKDKKVMLEIGPVTVFVSIYTIKSEKNNFAN